MSGNWRPIKGIDFDFSDACVTRYSNCINQSPIWNSSQSTFDNCRDNQFKMSSLKQASNTDLTDFRKYRKMSFESPKINHGQKSYDSEFPPLSTTENLVRIPNSNCYIDVQKCRTANPFEFPDVMRQINEHLAKKKAQQGIISAKTSPKKKTDRCYMGHDRCDIEPPQVCKNFNK